MTSKTTAACPAERLIMVLCFGSKDGAFTFMGKIIIYIKTIQAKLHDSGFEALWPSGTSSIDLSEQHEPFKTTVTRRFASVLVTAPASAPTRKRAHCQNENWARWTTLTPNWRIEMAADPIFSRAESCPCQRSCAVLLHHLSSAVMTCPPARWMKNLWWSRNLRCSTAPLPFYILYTGRGIWWLRSWISGTNWVFQKRSDSN